MVNSSDINSPKVLSNDDQLLNNEINSDAINAKNSNNRENDPWI